MVLQIIAQCHKVKESESGIDLEPFVDAILRQALKLKIVPKGYIKKEKKP
jgi:hypothetical protein